jgi:ubiquinone/menaquinone biosynthesis C-methylase UbiE
VTPAPASPDHTERVRTYFERLAPEYDRAFAATGGVVNRVFRGRTFRRRMRVLQKVLGEMDVAGAAVLDVACGSGQVGLLAAALGGRVHGIDIAERMVALARASAARAGMADRATFAVGDALTSELPATDVALVVGLLEYYPDPRPLMERVLSRARRSVVVGHANRVPYRALLRRLLFLRHRMPVYYHRHEALAGMAVSAGFRVDRVVREHAFTVQRFDRVG